MTALILTDDAPQWTIPTGANVNVFGTNGEDELAFGTGANVVLDASFNAGNDTIYIQSDSTDFTVSNSGSTVTLTDASDNTIVLPVGSTGQSLIFGDGALDLMFDTENNVVMLGDQTVSDTAAAVEATVDGTTTSADIFAGTGGENTAPDAVADTFEVGTGDQNLDVLANDSDADDDMIMFGDGDITVTGGPDGASATATYDNENNDINFNANMAGDYTFEYEIKDSHGGSDTATVTVTVTEAAGMTDMDLDELGGTGVSPAEQSADDGAYNFIDDIAESSNTEISGFGEDDQLTLVGITQDDDTFSYSESGGNVQIEFDNGTGTVSTITLMGVAVGGFGGLDAFNALENMGDVIFA